MVSKGFREELVGLSPWQLTQAVKDWMDYNDSRIELKFNWACTNKSQLESPDQIDNIWLKKASWKTKQKKIDSSEYVELA